MPLTATPAMDPLGVPDAAPPLAMVQLPEDKAKGVHVAGLCEVGVTEDLRRVVRQGRLLPLGQPRGRGHVRREATVADLGSKAPLILHRSVVGGAYMTSHKRARPGENSGPVGMITHDRCDSRVRAPGGYGLSDQAAPRQRVAARRLCEICVQNVFRRSCAAVMYTMVRHATQNCLNFGMHGWHAFPGA